MTDHTIKIYHIEGSRSLRIAWVCEELQVPYVLMCERGNREASMAKIREVSPLVSMAPVMEYDGQLIVESGAMVEFIQARFGNGSLAPAVRSRDFILHLQWLHMAEGSAMYRLWARRYAAMIAQVPVASVPDSTGLVGVKSIFDLMENHLGEHRYFGGSYFTTADIMMHIFTRSAKLVAGFDPANYSRVLRWRGMVEDRPAFKQALSICVPGDLNEFLLPKNMPMPPYDLPTGPAPVPSMLRASSKEGAS